MIYPLVLIGIAFLVSISSPAWAVREPKPTAIDHRVRVIPYAPDAVYKYTGHYRYQTAIEFAPDEQIRTISMGDSTGWMLNPSGNRLFLKPLDQDATTNMTLITNRRVYLFELHARETVDINDESMVFILRFTYPDSDNATLQTVSRLNDAVPNPDVENEPGKYNFNYTISGSDEYAPIKIFDDGEFTFFLFRDKNAEIPAFYVVNSKGEESVVNYRTRGDYIVLERVASRLTLRHGNDVVCVFNEARLARQASLK